MATEITRRSVLRGSLLAAGAVAFGSTLAGCTAGGSGGSGGKSTVTVMWQSAEFTPAYIKDFEKKNPGITIKFIEFDQNRLNAMLTAGNPPDVVRGSPSANLFARQLASPLDDYIAKSKVIHAADLEAVNDLWRWDGKKLGSGKRYGLIKDFSPDNTIWQNEAMFTQAGVTPLSTSTPASWDDLLDTAKKLKAGGILMPLGIEWQWGVSGIVANMIEQQGGQLFNDSLTKAQLDTPEGIRAIQWLIDYGKAGLGPTSLNPLTDGQDAPTFVAGKMAMTKDGFWFGANFQATDGATVGKTASLAPAPTFGKRISPVLGAVGGWIPSASKNKDGAWSVIEYFMGGQPAIDRAKSGWGLPALTSLWKYIPADEPYQKQAIALAKEEVTYVKPGQDSPYIDGTAWNGDLDKALQAGIQGSQTAEQIAQSVQKQMNVLLAQGKDQLG
ncbi:sugar ABC transporter substrate-binding protein [Planctomonas sp. JC2975]|uniref:extracellular solute-binding protein n=1 Tax=Planctomonas sp. JC2975 TaxID=2729626 RepID=UPI0014751B85|nr:sugar ABC transporter substrate-binding protein [Planctomonas sp. JC2975]